MAAEIPHSDLLFDFLYVHENENKGTNHKNSQRAKEEKRISRPHWRLKKLTLVDEEAKVR